MVVAPEGTADRSTPRVAPVENLRAAIRIGLVQSASAVDATLAAEPVLATTAS